MQKLESTNHYKITKFESEMVHTGSMRLNDYVPVYNCEIEYNHRTKKKATRFKLNGVIKEIKYCNMYLNNKHKYNSLEKTRASNYIIREIIKQSKKKIN